MDGSWQRLRAFAPAERRRTSRCADLVELEEPADAPTASAAEELAHTRADAVEQGILEPVDRATSRNEQGHPDYPEGSHLGGQGLVGPRGVNQEARP